MVTYEILSKSTLVFTNTVVAKSKLSFIVLSTVPINIPLGKSFNNPVVVTWEFFIISVLSDIPSTIKHFLFLS